MRKSLKYNKPRIKGVEIKRCSKSEQSYKEHLHEELSIGFIEEGSTVVSFNNKEYTFSKGEGIIIPPYLSHICKPKDINTWRFIMVYIDTLYYKGEKYSLTPRRLQGEGLKAFKEFITLMSEENEDFEVENSLIELLTTYVFRDEQGNEKYRDEIIDKIHNYIRENFLEEITLGGLEEMFKVNKFAIIRGFKGRYNTTPSSLRLQLKVAHSKVLLSKGMSILDVCSKIGFYDQSHFTREFKKSFGITPLKYQRDVLN